MRQHYYSALLSFAVSLSLLLMSQNTARAVPHDFDADGKSDRVVVQIADDGALEWSARGETAESSLGTSGQVGDHLILGNWLAASTPIIGYVRTSGSSVSWTIGEDQNAQSVTFGPRAGLIISGGDFNGDGITDATVVRSVRGRLRWIINTALFSGGTRRTVRHGTTGDLAFFMNVNGTRDGLGVLTQTSSGPFVARVRDFTTGNTRTITRISRSLKLYGRPSPLKRPDGKDVLVFTKKGSSTTTVVVVGMNGRRIKRHEINESVDTVIGEYLDAAGEEVAFATSSGFFVLNPFSGETSTLSSPSGIAVDEVNINQFDRDDDSGLPPPSDTCYEQDPTDGTKVGFIWKPESDTQFGAVVILPGTYLNKVSEVRTLTTTGTTIRTLSFKGNANPDPGNLLRPHYIDRTLQGSQYRQQYGSIVVEVDLTNGACLHYPIDNPAQRVD